MGIALPSELHVQLDVPFMPSLFKAIQHFYQQAYSACSIGKALGLVHINTLLECSVKVSSFYIHLLYMELVHWGYH